MLIMCGLPASGKNTWVSKFIEKNPSYVVVELDQIRSEIFGTQFYKPAEPLVIGLSKSFARLLLKQEKNIIINSTGITFGIRKEWVNMGEEYGYSIYIVYLDTSLTECIKRNSLRKSPVPDDVIYNMESFFNRPFETDDYHLLVDKNGVKIFEYAP